jgi:Transposase, Mutator family
VLDLYAGGMSVRDIAAHLSGLYGVEVGRDTISRVTDAVLEDVLAWRTRPLEAVYPIMYFDALMVKVREDRSVRSRTCYVAVGITVEGDREALGIWWQDSEGALYIRLGWISAGLILPLRGIQHKGPQPSSRPRSLEPNLLTRQLWWTPPDPCGKSVLPFPRTSTRTSSRAPPQG